MKNTEDATEHTEVIEIDEEQEISDEVRHAIQSATPSHVVQFSWRG